MYIAVASFNEIRITNGYSFNKSIIIWSENIMTVREERAK